MQVLSQNRLLGNSSEDNLVYLEVRMMLVCEVLSLLKWLSWKVRKLPFSYFTLSGLYHYISHINCQHTLLCQKILPILCRCFTFYLNKESLVVCLLMAVLQHWTSIRLFTMSMKLLLASDRVAVQSFPCCFIVDYLVCKCLNWINFLENSRKKLSRKIIVWLDTLNLWSLASIFFSTASEQPWILSQI